MTVSSNINVIRITKTTIINDELSTKRKESYPGYQRFFSRVAEPEFSVLAEGRHSFLGRCEYWYWDLEGCGGGSFSRISLQWTPDNSNLQGKSKKVRLIGSLKQITRSKEISKSMGRECN